MSKRNDAIYRYGKQGSRPRDLALAQKHWDRKRARTDLRTYRYLRAPRLYLPDFTIGAVTGMGMLMTALVVVGVLS